MLGSLDALKLAESEPGRLFATAGVHPHHAADFDASSVKLITELSDREAIVAVGECGLDYFRNFSPRDAQLKAFRSQLEIAAENSLPVFLHQRDAHDDFVETLEPMLPKLSRAVAHCFTGEHESLREYLAMGLWIGITGWICDERRGAHLHDIRYIMHRRSARAIKRLACWPPTYYSGIREVQRSISPK